MDKKTIQNFQEWWNNRKKTGQKVRGLPLSKQTLQNYTYTLKKLPNNLFNITPKNFEQKRIQLINYLKNYEKHTNNKLTPLVINTIKTYLKYLEEQKPELLPYYKFIRQNLGFTNQTIYQTTLHTDKLFFTKALTKKEVRNLIKFGEEEYKGKFKKRFLKIALLIRIAYDTGCRISEITSINTNKIIKTNKGWETHIIGKGNYERNVMISEETMNKIKEHKIKGLITKHTPNTLKKYLKQYIREFVKHHKELKPKEKKKILKITWHWFRHTRATHLAIIWKNVIKLQNYMGWQKIEMANRYVETSQKILEMLHYKSENLNKE